MKTSDVKIKKYIFKQVPVTVFLKFKAWFMVSACSQTSLRHACSCLNNMKKEYSMCNRLMQTVPKMLN